MRLWTILILALAMAILAAGCTPQQVRKYKAAVSSLNDQRPAYEEMSSEIQATIQELDDYIESLPEGEEKEKAVAVRRQLAGKFLAVSNWLDNADRKLAEYNGRLANTDDDAWAVAHETVQTVAEFIPAPWGKLAVLASGLLLTIRGSVHKRRFRFWPDLPAAVPAGLHCASSRRYLRPGLTGPSRSR